MKIYEQHLSNVKDSSFDVLVVGAGVTGAGIFRELTLNGVTTLLVDRGDFCSETSHKSSKMLHGGIRYLENLDFPLVFEALYEKNLWIKIAPHLAEERKFYLPSFKESKWPLWMNAMGLFFYDALSLFRNSPFKIYGKKRATEKIKGIREDGLKGTGLYHDAVVLDHKIGLESIYDGRMSGGEAWNYFELTKVEKKPDHVVCYLQDKLGDREVKVTAKELILAVGPFTDQVMHKLELPWEDVILPSKGSHITIPRERLEIEEGVVIQTKDGRIIFVIPRDEDILVGTTEKLVEGDLFNLDADEDEVQYLLDNLNGYFPNGNITRDDVLETFAGIRPLVRASFKNQHKTSRVHKNFHMGNIHLIVGGKLTTFRAMAQTIVTPVMKKLGKKYNKKLSLEPCRQKSVVGLHCKQITDEMIDQVCQSELVRTEEDVRERRLK